jgi:hypothetical protein
MKRFTIYMTILTVLSCTGCGEEPECTIGQRICENNVSKTCHEGHWRSIECANAAPICDETYGCIPIPQTCGNEQIEGTEECDGAALGGKTCNDMFTGLVGNLACHECKFDTSGCYAPGCAENTKRCGENGVETCTDGQWLQTQLCGTGERCDNAKAECVPYIACETPGVSCIENILSICAGGQLFETECTNGQVCSVSHASCEPRICDENARRCDGSKSQICIQNGWYDTMDCATSEMICDNSKGVCAPTCTEGETSCHADYSAVVSCQDGIQTVTECGPNSRCMLENGTPKCAPYVCDEGIECKGANPNSTIKMLKVCENNVLVKKETCKESDGVICSVTEAACVPLVCKADDVECQTKDGVSYMARCGNNAWVLEACTNGTVCTMDIEGDGSLSCAEKVCDEGYKCNHHQSVFCWNNNVATHTDCGDAGCDDSTGKCK